MKWAGGKGQLLEQLWPLLPEHFEGYHEPFIGGGALFFALRPPRATLFDVNPELASCYESVRDRVEEVIEQLEHHRYEKDYYYQVRAQDPALISSAAQAARTIFLNRTGFNGLYRVNSAGHFNVPFGRYKDPRICHAENLRACSSALAAATHISTSDFEQVLLVARPGDLVYFDPPYVPLSKTSDFTAYSADGFSLDDHVRLADVFSRLSEQGVKVMLSNSDTRFVRELYRDFEIDVVLASRNINSKASARGRISEVVVRNYPRRRPASQPS